MNISKPLYYLLNLTSIKEEEDTPNLKEHINIRSNLLKTTKIMNSHSIYPKPGDSYIIEQQSSGFIPNSNHAKGLSLNLLPKLSFHHKPIKPVEYDNAPLRKFLTDTILKAKKVKVKKTVVFFPELPSKENFPQRAKSKKLFSSLLDCKQASSLQNFQIANRIIRTNSESSLRFNTYFGNIQTNKRIQFKKKTKQDLMLQNDPFLLSRK